MPSTPYAKILVSVGGGALTSGGLTVAAGVSIHLQAESTVGWSGTPAPKWEIYEYPDGWSCPSGWSTDGAGVFFYNGVTPPDFTLPDISLWGKFMLRLTVNGSLVDDSTGLSVLSTQGFEDVAFGESNQFDTRRQYIGSLKSSLRLFDQAATTAANATSGSTRSPVKAATTASITLSGTQTIDGIACGVGDRVLVKNQTLGQNNGLYLVASGSWARTSDANSSALVLSGMAVPVQQGTQRGTWLLTTAPPITLGTTPLTFARLEDSINVKLFGAVGDGATDDTAAFTGAATAAAATGHPISVPPGAYELTGWTLSTAGLIVNGAGRATTTLQLSASAAQVVHVSASDVTFNDLTIDGGSHVTAGGGVIDTTSAAQRLNLYRVQLTTAPCGVKLAAGAGIDSDDLQIEVVATAGVQITDWADISTLRGVFNISACAAPMLEFVAGTNAKHDVVEVEHCKWNNSSGDSMVLTCQQPVHVRTSSFNADAQVNPTATYGDELVVDEANAFTNSGAVGFYDAGTPGTLTTYSGFMQPIKGYRAP